MRFKQLIAIAAAAALSLGVGSAVAAAQPGAQDLPPVDKTISAERLLAGDVKNVSHHIGRIKDLLLSEEMNRVRHVLYRVPNRYTAGAPETGFAVLQHVRLERTGGETDVLLVGDQSQRAPETLKLTRSDLRDRSVNRLIGTPVSFWDGISKPLSDLRIDPATGKISHFVVEMNPQALIFDEPRAIPADKVRFGNDGVLFSSLTAGEAARRGKF